MVYYVKLNNEFVIIKQINKNLYKKLNRKNPYIITYI